MSKTKPLIIKEVIQLMLDGEFKKSRKEAIDRGRKILNPHFFEQEELISFYSNKQHVIVEVTQPGVAPGQHNYTIQVAYRIKYDYQPYYDEWIKPFNRQKKLEEIGIL